MGSLKDFLQQPSAKKQYLKNAIIIFSVLFATMAATLLVGWLTSLNSSPVNQEPPTINFKLKDGFLTASSDSNIVDWKYVGPRIPSSCDASVFQDIVGFGASFERGNHLLLDFERDQHKYYCFRATDSENLSGFAAYHVHNLKEPLILFETEGEFIKAVLNPSANADLYTDDWSFTALESFDEACRGSAFTGISQEIVSGNRVYFKDLENNQLFCFRLRMQSGNYIYRPKLIILQNYTIAPEIQIIPLSGHLYLKANQPIQTWQTVVSSKDATCQWQSFKEIDDSSQENLAVIRIRKQDYGRAYCIRGETVDNFWGYKKYQIEPVRNQLDIRLTKNNKSQPVLTVENNLNYRGRWYALPLDRAQDCQKNTFNPDQALSTSNSIVAAADAQEVKLYCWQAERNGVLVTAATIIPPYNKSILPYKVDNQIYAGSLYPPMGNWRYTTTTNAPLSEKCAQVIEEVQEVSFRQPLEGQLFQFYCLKAADVYGGSHYSDWFYNQPLSPSSEQVALARDLGLSELGQHTFYQVQFKSHRQRQSLLAHCPSSVRFSCYNEKEATLHLLRRGDYLKYSDQIRRDIALALFDYLPEGSINVLRTEIEILYAQQSQLLNASLNDSLFLHNLHKNVYTFLIQRLLDNPENHSFGDFWSNYITTFFDHAKQLKQNICNNCL